MVVYIWGFPDGDSGKEPACQCKRLKRCWFSPWVVTIPWRRGRQPTPVFLPAESMDRGAWWAIVHRIAELGTTEATQQARTQCIYVNATLSRIYPFYLFLGFKFSLLNIFLYPESPRSFLFSPFQFCFLLKQLWSVLHLSPCTFMSSDSQFCICFSCYCRPSATTDLLPHCL